MKDYKEIDGKTYKLEFYYDMGGMNYFTGQVIPRGYYISVSPVEVERNEQGKVMAELCQAFSGYRVCVLEVKRASKKQEDFAKGLAEKSFPDLLNKVIAKQGAKV